jgi:O-acetyl-ADP-ribose deacetylase (regulator of RNase III)
MKIRYVTGNLLEAPERYILHGCNAQGVMGSGVAKLLRDKEPAIFDRYRETYELQGNHLILGQTIWVWTKDKIYINGITQEFYGREPGHVYVSYDAISGVIASINDRARAIPAMKIDAVAMPLIGAGLAQGDWNIISQLIEEGSTNFEPVVYLIDGVIPGQ